MAFTNPNENEIVYSGRSGLHFYDRWDDNMTGGPIVVDSNHWHSGAYDIEERFWNLYMATGGENDSIFVYERSYESDEYEMKPFGLPNVTESARFEELEFYYDHPFTYLFMGSPSIGVVRYTWSSSEVLYINTTNSLPSNNVLCMRVRGSTLLVGTNGGFTFFDLQTGSNFTCTEDDETETLVVDQIEYHQVSHKIFVGNEDGLFIFEENGSSAELVRSRITDDDGLESKRVTALELDLNRKWLYVGTYGGLAYIDIDVNEEAVIPMIKREQLAIGDWPEEVCSILVPKATMRSYLYLGIDSGFIVQVPVSYTPLTRSTLINIRTIMYGLGSVFLVVLWVWYSRAPTVPMLESIRNMTLTDLVAKGESEHIEYKLSLRWDDRKNEINKELEIPVIKAITGFMNAYGGVLLIGVNDKGEIVGLENDYSNLTNWDGFQNRLTSVFNDKVGGGFRILFELSKTVFEGKDICRVDVNPSSEPVFLEHAGKKVLVVRQGGRTQALNVEEGYHYIKRRWPSN